MNLGALGGLDHVLHQHGGGDGTNTAGNGGDGLDEVEPIVEAITPVPGGVGAVTTSVLMKHVVEAAEKI